MKWGEVCQAFPDQWVLIEANHAYTNDESERILEEVAPLKKFPNSQEAMRVYQELHPNQYLYTYPPALSG